MPVAHCFPWKEANLYTYFIGCNFRHYTKMASDGNDRRVYVGNLPPDIRTKVIYLVFLNQLFSIRQGCSMLNVGFVILLSLFPCAHLNIVITISKVPYRIRIRWVRIRIYAVSLNPDVGCCWTRIRMQSKVLFMTKLLSNLQLDYFLQPPTKDVQALQIWYFFIFHFFGDNFGLPGTGSGFPIWNRIRWPAWILVFKSGS